MTRTVVVVNNTVVSFSFFFFFSNWFINKYLLLYVLRNETCLKIIYEQELSISRRKIFIQIVSTTPTIKLAVASRTICCPNCRPYIYPPSRHFPNRNRSKPVQNRNPSTRNMIICTYTFFDHYYFMKTFETHTHLCVGSKSQIRVARISIIFCSDV